MQKLISRLKDCFCVCCSNSTNQFSTHRMAVVCPEAHQSTCKDECARSPGGNSLSKSQRIFRDLDPAHCIFPIDSFTQLRDKRIEPHESASFEAGGFRWKLALYTRGHGEGKKPGYISLYLKILGTEDFPEHWKVHAFFRFFVHDQIKDRYLTVQEPFGEEIKRFREVKKEQGIAELLSFEEFSDPSNGYLVKDRCRFGAEVFVVSPPRGFTSVKHVSDNTYRWTIENFSKLQITGTPVFSNPFSLDGTQWKLLLYPNGRSEVVNRSLSVFLLLHEPYKDVSRRKEWQTNYTITLFNKFANKHISKTGESTFKYMDLQRGYSDFIGLEYMTEAQGYKMEDKVIIELRFNSLTMIDRVVKKTV